MNFFNKNKKNIFSKLQKYFLIGTCAFLVFFVARGIDAAPTGNTTTTGSLPGATTNTTAPAQTATTQNTTPTSLNAAANAANSNSSGKTTSYNPIKNLLFGIFTLVSWLFLFAVVIFEWILKPDNFKLFLDSPAVREIWVMVRDFLNIGFIFFLLFSAFATIFQIEKYHIKSMIFKLILMALLVNFSFPIARFIIDVSNVTMYWLLNNIFDNMKGGAGIMATIAGDTGIAKTLLPNQANSEIARIIAATIFLFIFGITMLIIGVMFIIRLIALSILVMFSSIGFVAAAFPLTSKYASSWWDSLFKYSFFAPIMVFGMAIAIKLMQSIGQSAQSSMQSVATNQAVPAADPSFIAQGAFFAIPVVVLWATMGIAQKFSIEGAGAVTGQGKKLASWAGNLPSRGVKAGWNATGVPGGVKAGVAKFQKNGKLFGVKIPGYGGSDAREEKESRIAGFVAGGSGGYKSAKNDHERKKVNEMRKEWKDQGGANEDDLHKAMEAANAKSNPIKAKAAALELAEKHKFNNLDEFKRSAEMVKDDPVLKKMFDDKAKEKHVKFVIEYDIAENIRQQEAALNHPLGDPEKEAIKKDAYEKRLSGMSVDDLSKQKDLLNDDGFHEHYMKDKVNSTEPGDRAYVGRAANKLSPKDRRDWATRYNTPTNKRF